MLQDAVVQKKYDDLFISSKTNLLNNAVQADAHLNELENDKRLGLSLLIPVTGEAAASFRKVILSLNELEANQYYYPAADLHVTVLGLIAASDGFVLSDEKMEKYRRAINASVKGVSGFEIAFKGLTCSNAAVMAQGFFGWQLPKLRESLREEVQKNGLELKERYELKTAHATLMRFKEKLGEPEKFVEKIQELRDFEFGSMNVEKILLVCHDWYNRKEKTNVLGEYALA